MLLNIQTNLGYVKWPKRPAARPPPVAFIATHQKSKAEKQKNGQNNVKTKDFHAHCLSQCNCQMSEILSEAKYLNVEQSR